MTIKRYLARVKMSVPDFARKAGMDPVTLYRILNKETTPRGQTMRQIIEASEGKVTPSDILFGEDEEEEKKAS